MNDFFEKNKIIIAILVGAVIVGGAIYLSRSPEPSRFQPSSQTGILNELDKSDLVGVDTGCVIKGNISSNGKIYHLPGCGSYDKTVINESAGEKWFCTEAEAVSAGWRKAKNCP